LDLREDEDLEISRERSEREGLERESVLVRILNY
jgi:hypothetical protein